MITCRGQLPRAFARVLFARGYRKLTPVQRAVLRTPDPASDLLVSARTGSGKTLAFGLALARRLLDADGRLPGPTEPRALVVAPTRELARQVAAELGRLFASAGARVGCLTGGADRRGERAALAAGLDLVVGTPGRLCDHIARGALRTGSVGCVVIDEADELLAAGFQAELDALFAALPAARQTLLFSATVGPAVEALARGIQRGAIRIAIEPPPRPGVALQAVLVAPGDEEAAIVNLLRLHEPPAALVFCTRREAVARLARRLAARGFAVVELSGALNQPSRDRAVAAMREGRSRVCVATDLAARGLDLPGLDLVLHADLPASPEALLHRSGRTGRAGRPGLAVLVVPPGRRRRARTLAARAGLSPEWVTPPGAPEILARDLERMLAEIARPGPDARPAASLLALHAPERIAAAFARLWAAARPAPAPLAAPTRRP
jgi:ATP-dependent RNA helicase DeaD